MAINKIVYGEETLIDLTNDSVSADTLVEGATAHGKDGEIVTGTNPYKKQETDAEVDTQADLISQIATALEGKAAGGSGSVETYTGTIHSEALGNMVMCYTDSSFNYCESEIPYSMWGNNTEPFTFTIPANTIIFVKEWSYASGSGFTVIKEVLSSVALLPTYNNFYIVMC